MVDLKLLCPGGNFTSVGSLIAHGLARGGLPRGSTVSVVTGTPTPNSPSTAATWCGRAATRALRSFGRSPLHDQGPATEPPSGERS